MAEQRKGMGRGLAAILSVASDDPGEELRELPLELISPSPSQPRRVFDEEALRGLAESVKARGILQPVLVRPMPGGRYELIAGERRWRAAAIAELETIPAVVRHHDDATSLEMALIENMAREDLNAIEEARACAALVDELGLSHEEVGLRIGRSRAAVSNLIRLLELPDDALVAIERGELSEGHGRALLLAQEHAARRTLAVEAMRGRWSVRELEARARAANSATPRTRRRARTSALHPDQADALQQIEDGLGEVVGAALEVRAAGGGYRVQITFDSVEQALDFARRLRLRAAS